MATNQSCGIGITNDPWKQRLLQVLEEYGAISTKCNYDRQSELEQVFGTITKEYRFYACLVCRLIIPKQAISIDQEGFTPEGKKLQTGLDNGAIHLSTVLPRDTSVSCIYGKQSKYCLGAYIDFSVTNTAYIVQILQSLISDETIKELVKTGGNLDLIRPSDEEMNYLYSVVNTDYREDYTPPPQEIKNGQCVLTEHGRKHFDALIKKEKGEKRKTQEHEAKTCFPPQEYSTDNQCKFDEDCPRLNPALCEADPEEIKKSGRRYKCKESKTKPSSDKDDPMAFKKNDPQCYDWGSIEDVPSAVPSSRPKKYCHQTDADGKWDYKTGCWGTYQDCEAMYFNFRKYGPDGMSPLPSTHSKKPVMHDKFREILGRWLAIDLLLAIGSAYASSNMLQRLGPRPPIPQSSAISAISTQLKDTAANAGAVNDMAVTKKRTVTKTLPPRVIPSPLPKPRSEKVLWIAFGIFLGISLIVCIPIIAHALRKPNKSRSGRRSIRPPPTPYD